MSIEFYRVMKELHSNLNEIRGGLKELQAFYLCCIIVSALEGMRSGYLHACHRQDGEQFTGVSGSGFSDCFIERFNELKTNDIKGYKSYERNT